MPAQGLRREDGEGIYSHIYNKGVENRTIFNDQEDYEVFLGYLRDYLTSPQDPEATKKAFTVHGRTFRGTPHQPKNYLGKTELVAYSLFPNHFHLVLHQLTKGSIEKLIRSLCTRYSIYFNKKYERNGSLFAGAYKSVKIDDDLQLPHLTRYFHYNSDYSSYPEYLGERETSWVKPQVALSTFDNGAAGYKSFVENYKNLDRKEKGLIADIIIESENQHLVKPLANDAQNHIPETQPETNLKPIQRVPEFLAATAVFLLLFTFGIRNIMAQTAKIPNEAPAVLSQTAETSPSPIPTDAIKPKILTIKISDGAASVNIRQEPTTSSQKVGEAKDGDNFDFVSFGAGWYEIKLADGSTAFISAKYIKEEETNNQ